jgi:hypothetical protein
MQVQKTFEDYLLQTMVELCPNGKPSNDHPQIEDLGLFDTFTPFERVARVLGSGQVSDAREIPNAPESLKISTEHRYSLERWPVFDFVILESSDGLAWGHSFARRIGLTAPPIGYIADLSQWSHVESEVRAALGAPTAEEGWPPWETALYPSDGSAFALCYVYGLLQSVRRIRDDAKR